MTKFSKSALILALVLLMGALAACGGTQDQGGNTNQPAADNSGGNDGTQPDSAGGAMEMSIAGDVHLDPAVVALDDEGSLLVSSYLYEGLLRPEDGGGVAPGIAFEYQVSDDGLTYEFSLRADAVFSNGDPINADVVMDNFNRWFDPEHRLHGDTSANYQAWLECFGDFRGAVDEEGNPTSLFDGIEKVDNLTVLIHLNEPMDNFLVLVAQPPFSILNPATLEAEGAAYGTMDGSVVSSGPYELAEWTADGLTLTPSASYWGDTASGDLVFTFE